MKLKTCKSFLKIGLFVQITDCDNRFRTKFSEYVNEDSLSDDNIEDEFFANYVNVLNYENDNQIEFSNYLLEKPQKLYDNNSIMNYWRSRTIEFPLLSKMARDYLAVPISSSSVERTFSVASMIQNKQRNKLNCYSLEALLLLNNWQIRDRTRFAANN